MHRLLERTGRDNQAVIILDHRCPKSTRQNILPEEEGGIGRKIGDFRLYVGKGCFGETPNGSLSSRKWKPSRSAAWLCFVVAGIAGRFRRVTDSTAATYRIHPWRGPRSGWFGQLSVLSHKFTRRGAVIPVFPGLERLPENPRPGEFEIGPASRPGAMEGHECGRSNKKRA